MDFHGGLLGILSCIGHETLRPPVVPPVTDHRASPRIVFPCLHFTSNLHALFDRQMTEPETRVAIELYIANCRAIGIPHVAPTLKDLDDPVRKAAIHRARKDMGWVADEEST